MSSEAELHAPFCDCEVGCQLLTLASTRVGCYFGLSVSLAKKPVSQLGVKLSRGELAQHTPSPVLHSST